MLTAIGRCKLVTCILPVSLRLALTLGNRGGFTDVGELFERAHIGIQALQAQSDAFSSYAQAAAGPSTHRARKAKPLPWFGRESVPTVRKRGTMRTSAHGERAKAQHDGGSQLNLVSQRWATKNRLAM